MPSLDYTQIMPTRLIKAQYSGEHERGLPTGVATSASSSSEFSAHTALLRTLQQYSGIKSSTYETAESYADHSIINNNKVTIPNFSAHDLAYGGQKPSTTMPPSTNTRNNKKFELSKDNFLNPTTHKYKHRHRLKHKENLNGKTSTGTTATENDLTDVFSRKQRGIEKPVIIEAEVPKKNLKVKGPGGAIPKPPNEAEISEMMGEPAGHPPEHLTADEISEMWGNDNIVRKIDGEDQLNKKISSVPKAELPLKQGITGKSGPELTKIAKKLVEVAGTKGGGGGGAIAVGAATTSENRPAVASTSKNRPAVASTSENRETVTLTYIGDELDINYFRNKLEPYEQGAEISSGRKGDGSEYMEPLSKTRHLKIHNEKPVFSNKQIRILNRLKLIPEEHNVYREDNLSGRIFKVRLD